MNHTIASADSSARSHPPVLAALMAELRATVEMQRITHVRAPIFAHWELVQVLDAARRNGWRGRSAAHA